MNYRTKAGMPDKEQWGLFDEALNYFRDNVAPLYMDLISADPVEGLYQALTDFLSNDSYWDDEDGALTWDDILRGMTVRN